MLQFNGTAERPTNDRMPSIGLNLEPADSRPGMAGGRGRVDPSGTFSTVGVPPGKYFIRVAGAPQGWTFHSASVNGRDASVVPIDIENNDVSGVMIVFTDKPSEFAGDVSVDTGSPESLSVLVFPSDPTAWVGYGSSSRRFSSTRVGKDGKFRVMNLPAGEYFAVALPDRLASRLAESAVSRIAGAGGDARARARRRTRHADPEGVEMNVRRVFATVLAALALGLPAVHAGQARDQMQAPKTGTAVIAASS
jgi:hypothetical protein